MNTKNPSEACDFEDRDQFGLALTELRERAGLSIRDVASALRIPPATAGDYFSGRSLPTARMARVLSRILGLCGVTDREVVEGWHRELARLRRGSTGTAPTPYRGLFPFQERDARWFHGRDRLVRTLTTRIEARRRTGGLIAVVGPSGAGKSSLLRAGVLPALRDRTPVLTTLGRSPCRELSDQLCDTSGIVVEEMDRAIHTDPAGAADLVRRAEPAGLVIVVDQFEELFDPCHDERTRGTFVDSLAALATREVVVLGLRSDRCAEASRHPLLAAALDGSRVDVTPMNDAELRDAVERPARMTGRELENGLVEVLLRDMAPQAGHRGFGMAHDPGALPLLSEVLLATWRQRKRGRVTVADYLATGGVRGVGAELASRAVDALSASQTRIAHEVVQRVLDGAGTARREQFPENSGEAVDVLVAHRLLTSDRDTVAVSHHGLRAALSSPALWNGSPVSAKSA